MEIKKESALKFFQQSAWVGIAAAAGGGFMGLINTFADVLGKEEYGIYTVLSQAWPLMSIPSLGLAAVFMQFAVSAEALGHRSVLAGAVRSVFKLNLVLWSIFGLVFFLFRHKLGILLGVSGSAFLFVTALVPPASAFLAIFVGVLQGEQNFAFYGWLQVLAGASRLVLVSICIGIFGANARSLATGVLFGFLGTLAVAGWETRSIWKVESAPFHSGLLAGKILIYTAGLGASAMLLGLDSLTVRNFFSEQDTGIYGAAGIAGRVLIPLSGALIIVMFPKVSRSKALAGKTSALALTLGLTALGAAGAALFLTLFPSLPIRLLQGKKYIDATPFIPMYCWSLIPLAMGNVLLYNLLGRERYAAIPFLVLIAGGYAWRLWTHHGSFEEVIHTMGLAGLAFLAVTVFFTWVWKEQNASLERLST